MRLLDEKLDFAAEVDAMINWLKNERKLHPIDAMAVLGAVLSSMLMRADPVTRETFIETINEAVEEEPLH